MKPVRGALAALVRIWGWFFYHLHKFFLSRATYDTVMVRLRGRVIEAPVRFSWMVRPEASGTPLINILKFFRFVEKDPKVKRLVIHIAPISMGWSQTQSVARAIAAVTGAGIETIAFFERGGNREYYLAAHCKRILAPPTAVLNLIGILLEMVYFRELLDKIAVAPDIHAKGKYKNAAETVTRKSPTRASREMMDHLADGVFRQYVEQIADARNVKPEKAEAWINQGPYIGTEAVKAGVIDEAIYYDDLIASFDKEEPKPVRVKGSRYFRAWSTLEANRVRMKDAGTVALVYAHGPIVDSSVDRPGSTTVTDAICADLRSMAKDDRIKAVVLRVSSPGGSSVASDLIWRSLGALREKKPVIVSMGDVAASGGYYIAMAGDAILVESGTLTGSIGVIIGKFSLQGLYRKLGIGRKQFKRGDRAGIYSDAAPFSESEKDRIQSMLDATYKDFVSKVAQSRGLTRRKAEGLAQGRVYLGSEAVSKGLADEIGDLNRAMAVAREKMKVEPDEPLRIAVYPRPKPPWKTWFATGLEARLPEPLARITEELSELSTMDDGPQFRLPYLIRFL